MLKLYSVEKDDQPSGIDREGLLDALLKLARSQFGENTEYFDIYGPYGIPKGQPVRLEAFLSRLKERGHNRYQGYRGYSPSDNDDLVSRFGFRTSFDSPSSEGYKLNTVVIDWLADDFQLDEATVVRQISASLPVSYGFSEDIPELFDVLAESPFKRPLLGSVSTSTNANYQAWQRRSSGLLDGEIRGIYSRNYLTELQLRHRDCRHMTDPEKVADGLYVANRKPQ